MVSSPIVPYIHKIIIIPYIPKVPLLCKVCVKGDPQGNFGNRGILGIGEFGEVGEMRKNHYHPLKLWAMYKFNHLGDHEGRRMTT